MLALVLASVPELTIGRWANSICPLVERKYGKSRQLSVKVVVSSSLTADEVTIVNDLRRAGLAPGSAALAVAMATREHSRPEAELVDIVRQYQSLETKLAAADAINDLKIRGWLSEYVSYGTTLLRAAPDLRTQIARRLTTPSVADRLLMLRAVNDPYVQVIGHMNDEVVYTSYLDVLRGARSEICLPMLATTPTLASVPILQERAANGVNAKILLGEPSLVARLRGKSMAGVAADAIAGWRAHAKGRPAFKVRVATNEADLTLATSLIVDGQLLRVDVYDPRRQRSLQGVLLEVKSPADLELNLVRVCLEQFERAWRRARPAGLPYVLWWVRREIKWVLAGLMVVATVASRDDTVTLAIVGSMAATQIMNALASSKDDLQAFFKTDS
jgi:hypothetical protein